MFSNVKKHFQIYIIVGAKKGSDETWLTFLVFKSMVQHIMKYHGTQQYSYDLNTIDHYIGMKIQFNMSSQDICFICQLKVLNASICNLNGFDYLDKRRN